MNDTIKHTISDSCKRCEDQYLSSLLDILKCLLYKSIHEKNIMIKIFILNNLTYYYDKYIYKYDLYNIFIPLLNDQDNNIQ